MIWQRAEVRKMGLAGNANPYGRMIFGMMILGLGIQNAAIAVPLNRAENLDLDPKVIQSSPTLQKWLQSPPNVLREIRNQPSFKTRLRVGYSRFGKSDAHGWTIGVEDLQLGRSPLTFSADYSAGYSSTSPASGASGSDDPTDRSLQSFGANLHLYALPLGSYVNITPVVGYRSFHQGGQVTDGVNLGARLLLVPSRRGGADLLVQQTWVNVGTDTEVGMGKVSVGYAITRNFRLGADLERWQGRSLQERRATLLLEWIP
ncbi:MAG: hypothetical protein VKJ24_16795 [Synechococcales bacterium]|nr:hypothetical protein [Synechococcales bacterium]